MANAVADLAEVEVLSPSTHPWLADRDDAATEALRREISEHDSDVVINMIGRLRGTDDEMHDANVAVPRWLVGAVADTGARLCHIGSASEYGDPGGPEPIPETRPADPIGIYGTTKWAGSSAVLEARAAGLDAVVARGFNLVGDGQPPGSPLHQFLSDVAALEGDGGEIEVWEPRTLRDFILLTDLANGVARLSFATEVPDIVNLCSGVGIFYGDIAAGLLDRRGRGGTVTSRDAGGIMAVVGDNARMVEVCGFRPEMSLELLLDHARLAD